MPRVWSRKVTRSKHPFETQNNLPFNLGYSAFTNQNFANVTFSGEGNTVMTSDMLNCYRKASSSTSSEYCVPDMSNKSWISCSDIKDPPTSTCTVANASCPNNYKKSPVSGAF